MPSATVAAPTRADALAVVGVHQPGEAVLDALRRDHDVLGRYLQVVEDHFGLGDAAQPHRRLAVAEPGAAARRHRR
jgi:hypothetical protein